MSRGATALPRPYVPLSPGPRLDLAWTVRAGIVAVTGERETLTLPVGATWPGLDALPPQWLDELLFCEAIATPGTLWASAETADLPAGTALVCAQLLRSGPMVTRLQRLDALGLGRMNQSVQAALIGSRRESVSKVRGQMSTQAAG